MHHASCLLLCAPIPAPYPGPPTPPRRSYVPVGLLDVLPQQMNHRPPAFCGRSDLETLFASDSPQVRACGLARMAGCRARRDYRTRYGLDWSLV